MGLCGLLWAASAWSCWIIAGCDILYSTAWQRSAVSFAAQPGAQPQLGGAARQRWLQRKVIPGYVHSTWRSHVQRSAPVGSTGNYHVPAPAIIHRSLPRTPDAVRAETWQLGLPSVRDQERGCGATSVRAVALAHAGDAGSTFGFLNSRRAAESVQRTQMLVCCWARVRR